MAREDQPIQLTVGELQTAIAGALRQAGVGNNQQGNNSSSRSGSGDFRTTTRDFNRAVGGVTGFLNQAGGTVSGVAAGLASTIPVFGRLSGVVGNGIGYLEESNAVFQQLSKVGAGFNGDLGALRAAAADTRLPLGEFANLVGQNSELLAGLGAGVNQGAKRFAALSRAMFEDGDVIGGMMNLGYTIGESNEMLMEQAGLLSRQSRLRNMDDKAVAEATLQMAANMAVVAEITGKNAEQQREDMLNAARDGKNIAANRRLESQGITDASQTFADTFALLAPLGPQAQAFFSDMNQAQTPLSRLTQNFEAMNGETAGVIREIDRIRRLDIPTQQKQQMIQAAVTRAQGVAAREYVNSTNLFAGSMGQISDIGQNVADNIGETERARQGVEQARLDLARERFGLEANAPVSDAQLASVSTQDAALRYVEEIRNIVGGQQGGGGTNQTIQRELNQATIGLANSAAQVNKEIATNLSANTVLLNQITNGLGAVVGVGGSLADIGTTAIRGLAPGRDTVADNLNRNFTSLFTPIINNNAMNVNIQNLDTMLTALREAGELSPEQLRTALELARERQSGSPRAIGGSVLEGMAYKIGELGPETFVPQMDGAIIPNMKAMLNRMPDIANTMQAEMESLTGPMAQAAQQAATQMQNSGTVEQKLDILNQTLLQLVNINTMQARTGERALKQTRSVGNLMGGIGRA